MRRIHGVLLVALLAGCSSGGGGGTAAPAPTSSASSVPSATTGTGDAPVPTASAAPSTSASPDVPRCHTAGLKAVIAPDEGGGAAGTEYESLVFTNTSTKTCTLYGYPGVSYVTGDQGNQVNDPFTRTPGKRATARLAPKGQAHATLGIPNWQNFPAGDCKPAAVRGFRIYPPDETAALFVSQPQTVCSAKGKGLGQVEPIVAGGAAKPTG
jgi:hypothetical protein